MAFNNIVNDVLQQMAETGGVGKGVFGEDAVFKICERVYQKEGGLLYHSYEYPVNKNLPGNIKRNADGNFFLENLGSSTEIDVLLVTPFRIFPIEVKAYKAKEIVLDDKTIAGCFKVDKSPIHQNEMHCRHLYSEIFKSLCNGETKYIVPIVVFVDKCMIRDKRSSWQKDYIKVATLNTLESTIRKYDVPAEYRLNLDAVANNLKNSCTTYKKLLPCRKVDF